MTTASPAPATPGWVAPHFSSPFCATRHKQGGDAHFRSVVSASPSPTVRWTHRGRELPHSDKHYQYFDLATGELSLTIRDLGPGDEGCYTCKVENPYGEVTATLKVGVRDRQRVPSFGHSRPKPFLRCRLTRRGSRGRSPPTARGPGCKSADPTIADSATSWKRLRTGWLRILRSSLTVLLLASSDHIN